jgi:hypothetical protein
VVPPVAIVFVRHGQTGRSRRKLAVNAGKAKFNHNNGSSRSCLKFGFMILNAICGGEIGNN